MKIKLVHSNFDKNTGISIATISTDYGYFTGKVKLHDEDKDISSSFAGCQYAEMKAILAYMKKRISIINIQIKGLENCIKSIKNRKNYNHNSLENRAMRKEIYLLKKQKMMWEDKKISLHNKLMLLMTRRQKIVQTLKLNKGEENNNGNCGIN